MTMKKAVLALLVALSALSARAQFLPGASYSDLYDSETVRAFKEHVEYIAAADKEGRKAGSEGEALAAAYLREAFEKEGITMVSTPDETITIRTASGDTVQTRNVIALIEGSNKAYQGQYIVIGARLDGRGADAYMRDGHLVPRIFYGANGNASGVAMLIELAKKLSRSSLLLGRSVMLVGFGASGETFAGAWHFIHNRFPSTEGWDAMIDLDMLGCGTFSAFTASNQDMNALLAAESGELQPIKPEIVGEAPYPSDNMAFYNSEIPSVMFTTGHYVEYNTERDTPSIIDYELMEKELEYICGFTLRLSSAATPLFNNESVRKQKKQTEIKAVPYGECDVKPTFLGSRDPKAFLDWVYNYLEYPREAVERGIQGKVILEMVIDAKGNIAEVEVVRGVSPSLDAEAVRVVKAAPGWKPGRVGGVKVATVMTIPVQFILKDTRKGKVPLNGVVLEKKRK